MLYKCHQKTAPTHPPPVPVVYASEGQCSVISAASCYNVCKEQLSILDDEIKIDELSKSK
jgi:hypothetical protein